MLLILKKIDKKLQYKNKLYNNISLTIENVICN